MRKEIIALLEKAKINTEHIDDCCHDQKELMEIRQSISEPIDQVLAALKAEPKAEFTRLPDGRQVNLKEFTKECRELIKTEEDDKGWKAISGYIVWLETRAELACELIDSQQAEQPKAGEFTKEARRQLDIGVNVLDGFLREACDKIDSQEAELASAKERIEGLEKVFGMDEPWSLLICAKQLVMSANHLLNDHNCDGDGYEKTEIAKRQMEKYIIRVEQALKAKQKG